MEKNKNVIVPSKVVGIFEKSKNFGFVKPDDKKNFKKDIFIPKAFSKNAINGQKVVVEIIKESVEGRKSEGKIVEILGFPDQAGIDMLSIIKQFDLPCEFSKEVIEAVDIITKKKGEDYQSYLNSVKKNKLARAVKLADLRHNSDLTRLTKVTEKDIERKEKYQKAIDFLNS